MNRITGEEKKGKILMSYVQFESDTTAHQFKDVNY